MQFEKTKEDKTVCVTDLDFCGVINDK